MVTSDMTVTLFQLQEKSPTSGNPWIRICCLTCLQAALLLLRGQAMGRWVCGAAPQSLVAKAHGHR